MPAPLRALRRVWVFGLVDGWVVKQIAGDAVQLERGTSRVTVKLRP